VTGPLEQRQWLTRAKLMAPRHEVRLVARPYLLDVLDQFLERRLGVIVAPAGFGKTTLLAEWQARLKSRGVVAAWLTLDEADGELHQFLSGLIFALGEAGLELGWLEPLAEQGLMEGSLKLAVSGILEVVAACPRPVVLILDDYHRLDAPAVDTPSVDTILAGLIAAAPRNLTFVLNSRVRPNLDVSRLMAAGVAVEMTVDSLRFSKAELAQTFDRPLEPAEVDFLYERTEGWPVAVQLARLLIGSDETASASLSRFTGGSGHIAAYLADQVLANLADETRDFLLRTSILERFNGGLADAVTGRNDASARLRELEPLNALLVPLNEARDWYRYHHLFAECLRDLLMRQYGDKVRAMHLEASRWFEAGGHVTEAVRHAKEAGNFDRCADLTQKAGGWELILFGGIGSLRSLLRQIPDLVAHAYPRILVAKSYLCLKDGKLSEARAYFDAACSGGDNVGASHEPASSSELARDLLNVGSLLDVYEDRQVNAADIDKLKSVIARYPQNDPLTIAILACKLILMELALGHLHEAEMQAQQAMRVMRQARTVLGLNYCFLHAGLAALYQGRLQVAKAHFDVARRMAEENFGSDPGLKALSNFLLGVLHHWQGTLTPDLWPDFLENFEHVERYDGWCELYISGLEVECAGLNAPEKGIARANRIIAERGHRRLEVITTAKRLRYIEAPSRDALARQLELALQGGIWRKDPFLWLPFIESRLALAYHLAPRNRAQAIDFLDEALECARSAGAVIFMIDILAARALVLDQSGDRKAALSDILEALSMAAPEKICRPFERRRELATLLRAVIKASREEYVDILVLNFTSELLGSLTSAVVSEGGAGLSVQFSPREHEVFEELAHGRTNKEIARALDMTEHTVKFHLKNIFSKLDVDRRTQALARARSLRLI
jgi:LuxR family maltose regulon positive regulatory protein